MPDIAPIFWSPDVKSRHTRKYLDTRKQWRQEEKGMTADEMVGCISDSRDMCLSSLWKMVKDKEPWHAAVHGVVQNWIWLSNWTTTKRTILKENQALIWFHHPISNHNKAYVTISVQISFFMSDNKEVVEKYGLK